MRYIPRKQNKNYRIIDGTIEYICERICNTYVETGRTMRSLAKLYKCSPSTISNYLNKYARNYVSYDLYSLVRQRSNQNMLETYELGRSENCYSDEYGSMD